MNKPLHIGWLIWGDEGGGAATAVLNNASLIQSLGQRVSIWSLGPGTLVETLRRRGLSVHLLGESAELHRRYVHWGFSVLGLLRRGLLLLSLRATLRQGLRAGEVPDVLCLPWPDLMILAGPIGRELGMGLVLEMPGTPSIYPLDLNQRAYAWITRRWRVRMLANSEFSASRMQRIPGVAVVMPAVNAARFDPAHVVPVERALLGLPADALVLGLIARLDPSKGADLVIAAIAALGDAAADLHLLVVGGPLASDYGRALQAQAKAAGLEHRIHWVDTVPDPERYWASCDFAISTYRYVEAFGLSIIEAMLMQRPVIAHSLGQPGSTIDDGRTGWLFHQPEVSALAEALRRALAARPQWPTMGRQARTEALRRFASPEAGQRYLQLLREQAAQAQAAGR